ERPSRVYGETAQRIHATNEDLLFGLLQFPSGATGMLDVNWLTPAKRRELIVVGEEGMFELDYLTQRLTFTRATDTTNPRLIGGSIELPVPACGHGPAIDVSPWTGEPGTAGKVAVVGAGKMGLPLAAQFADHGWHVIAVDVQQSVVDAINEGRSHVAEEPGLA